MANIKLKIVVFLSFISFFIFLLVITGPFPNIYAENLLSGKKFSGISNISFKFPGEISPNLKILDLNTMLIPFEFVAPAYQERAQELKEFILKDYDTVLLQEVFSKKIQRDFIERWYSEYNLGMPDISSAEEIRVYDEEIFNQRPNDVKVNSGSGTFFVSGPQRLGFESLFGSGLLLLSRYPIIDSNVFCYTERAGSDIFASKGVIYAKIKIGENPNEYVNFFTTHLQSHNYINSRQNNIEELLKFVSKIISDEIIKTKTINPVIIAGDFNVPANWGNLGVSSEYKHLVESINSMCAGVNDIFPDVSFYLRDLWAQKNPGIKGYTWIAKNEEEIKNSPYGELGNTLAIEKKGAERIDYIFYFEGNCSSIKTESLNINLVPQKPEKIYSFKNGKLKSYTLSDHLGLDAEFKIIK